MSTMSRYVWQIVEFRLKPTLPFLPFAMPFTAHATGCRMVVEGRGSGAVCPVP